MTTATLRGKRNGNKGSSKKRRPQGRGATKRPSTVVVPEAIEEPTFESETEEDAGPVPVEGVVHGVADRQEEGQVDAEAVTVHVEGGEQDEAEQEASGPTPDEPAPQSAPLGRRDRQKAARRQRQAASLGLPVTDQRFLAAVSNGTSFAYLKGLGPKERALVTPEEVRDATPISPEQFRERRLARWDLLEDADVALQAGLWGLEPDHANVKWAREKAENWAFARTLTPEQITYLSAKNRKTLTPPSKEDIDRLKKIRAEEEAKARAKREQEEKAAAAAAKKVADAQKRVEGEAAWAKHRDEVLAGIKARLAAEAPGLAESTIRQLVTATDERIAKNASINIDNQIKTLDKSIDTEIAKAAKRAEIDKVKEPFKHLKGTKLRDLIEAVVADPKKSVEDFKTEAEALRIAQRNLEGVTDKEREWARILGLRLYGGRGTPFESLKPRDGLPTHYSVDLSGILAASGITATTTAAELLEKVLGVATRHHRLHVSLETGFTLGPDNLKLPHRYWGTGAAGDYDYTTGGYNRWYAPYDKARVKAALDEAYQELHDRLTAAAQRALDRDCNV